MISIKIIYNKLESSLNSISNRLKNDFEIAKLIISSNNNYQEEIEF